MKTLEETAKSLGTSAKELLKEWGCSRQVLAYMFKHHPDRFEIIAEGIAAMYTREAWIKKEAKRLGVTPDEIERRLKA